MYIMLNHFIFDKKIVNNHAFTEFAPLFESDCHYTFI